jgi:hypothetical protein
MLLTGLADGEESTADLTLSTGLPERTVRRGLHRLIGSGHVFSPERGSYRLTSAGDAVVGELSAVAPTPTDAEPLLELPQARNPVQSSTGTPWWVWAAAGAASAIVVLGDRRAPRPDGPSPVYPGPLRVGPSGWRSAY